MGKMLVKITFKIHVHSYLTRLYCFQIFLLKKTKSQVRYSDIRVAKQSQVEETEEEESFFLWKKTFFIQTCYSLLQLFVINLYS